MDAAAGFIARVLAAPDDEAVARAVRADVEALTRRSPLYPELSATTGNGISRTAAEGRT